MVTGGASSLPHHVHLVGIGGAGLSAIARVLVMRGHRVTGSDRAASASTRALNAIGVETWVGHAAEQVVGADLVVASSAIPDENVELVAARAAGIPVLRRQELMPRLMTGSVGIAVAGTHGKTTTAAMLAVALERLGLAPSYIVGGVIADLGANASAGAGPYFVIEVDEYGGMFLGLDPRVAVVTNVEMDHPDYYRDLDAIREAFARFLKRVPPEGVIIACGDSAELARLLVEEPPRARVVTYGQGAGVGYRVERVEPAPGGGVAFEVVHAGAIWGRFSLAVPGAHNALNATAALLVAEYIGVAPGEVGGVLAGFHGALRRFEIKGERAGVTVIDDYAHHPTEIRATLAAARGRYDGRRIWAVWEPHTYSRIEALLTEFGTSFGDADRVIVTDVYAARSRERATITPERIVASIEHANALHIGGSARIVSYLLEHLERGDVLLTLGAGDGYRVGEDVLAGLAREGT